MATVSTTSWLSISVANHSTIKLQTKDYLLDNVKPHLYCHIKISYSLVLLAALERCLLDVGITRLSDNIRWLSYFIPCYTQTTLTYQHHL